MPKVKKSPAKKTAGKKKISKTRSNYLTKRILTVAAKTGFTRAAAETVAVMGFNVIVHKGWVVKKYADGKIERINKLAKTKSATSLVLD